HLHRRSQKQRSTSDHASTRIELRSHVVTRWSLSHVRVHARRWRRSTCAVDRRWSDSTHYFGRYQWGRIAPMVKTLISYGGNFRARLQAIVPLKTTRAVD